jgi:DNA-binding transcriptional LysR family regulator
MKSCFRNWSDVRVFLAVMREGSTLAASRKLEMAQPTVARRVEALEHAIGLTLFERDTRGFRPTDVARSLFPRAEEIEESIIGFAKAATDLCGARPIRITAFSGNFSPRVNNIFNEFSLLHPDVQFELLPGVRVFDLIAGEADIALRLTRSTPDPNLICRKISTAHYALYGSREYAEKNGLPKSVNDLRGHSFVSFRNENASAAFHEWLMRNVTPEQIVRTFAEFGLMHAAIRAGHGLGIVNQRYAETDDTLIQCFEPLEELNSEHLMLISPDAHRRPEVRAFTKFFAPRYAAIFK